MDNSTENVTLFAAFINDILRHYDNTKEEYKPLFAMTEGYDLSEPFNKVPIQLYNDLCLWVENELGKFNLIRVGRSVGETAFGAMKANGLVHDKSTPLETMQALVTVASSMIQDPKMRGWEIIENNKNSIVMRRTQTFNRQLQLGLLDALIRKSGVTGVRVDFRKSIESGAEFDEYIITWF